jgi:hypothetical protein
LEDGRVYVNGQEFNTWFAEGAPSYATEVEIYDVLEKTTDCFRVTLRITYTESQYYKKYTLYVPPSEGNPAQVEYTDKTEDTVLFTEDVDFTFIAGENLHEKIMEQESVLQAALDGYFKEETIKDRGQGAINSMHITTLTGWNPSEG